MKSVGSFFVTEKSCIMKDKLGQIVFVTEPSVTKLEFKLAFASRFKDLKLIGLSSVLVKGKARRFRGKMGSRSDRKKFIASVEGGKSLDLEKL